MYLFIFSLISFVSIVHYFKELTSAEKTNKKCFFHGEDYQPFWTHYL